MDDKLKRTMRVEIGTEIYSILCARIERNKTYALEGKLYKITGASRIERTNNVRFELEAVDA